MENRPPLAPKPDSLKESPSHPSPTSSPAAGAPVPRPRKKPGAPPPAKPMPYRKHVELKDKEVSTFKSSTPVAPPRVKKHPAVPAAKPSPPSYRLSIPGEPSDLFQLKPESKTPVQYGIPQVPKRQQKPSAVTLAAIDTRPRLDTPQVVPDPDDVLGLDKQGGAVPIESHGTPSNYHPTTQSSTVNGIAGGDNDGVVPRNDESELYTEAYAHVESEENDAEYAVVSPSRKAVVPTPQSSSSSIAVTGKSSPPHLPPPAGRGRPSPIPPIAAGSQFRRSPSPAPPPIPPPAQSIPTATAPKPSSHPLLNPPTVDGSIDDHEYNTTSHVQGRVKKRSRGTPPLPPPIAPPVIRSRSPPLSADSPTTGSIDDHEYNTTSHVQDRVKKRSRGTPPIPPPIASPVSISRSPPLSADSPTTGSIDDHEYNTTSHVKDKVKKKRRGTPPIPPPTAPPMIRPRSTKSPPSSTQLSAEDDEYSVLDRPDKKTRAISPIPTVQPSSESEEYSVLSSEPDEKKPPQVSEFEEYSVLSSEPQAVPSTCTIPDETEGYGRLDLDAISASSITNSENSGGNSSVYEEIRSEPPIRDDKASGVGPSPPPPVQPQMDKHPRALARKASDKFKDVDIEATVLSSRDRSKLPAYQQPSMDESGGEAKERSGARLPPRNRAPPPIPQPKRQKKMPPQQNTDEAATTPTSISSSSSESVSVGTSKAEVPLNVLEKAGYETRNTFSPPPEDMEVERKEQKSSQVKPPTPTRRVSPVPAKARGPKPPPMPKPKQISLPSPQRAAKVATSGGLGPTKGEESTPATSTDEGQNMEHEPVCTSGDPSSMEAVDGSHDNHMTGVHTVRVSSPKIELDIDHITRVGSALVDSELENMAEALYDNQTVVNAVGLGDNTSSPEQQKRASRTSYENQVVVDAVQQGDSWNGAADSTMEIQQGDGTLVTTGGDGSQGSLEQNLQQNNQETEMEVCKGDQVVESETDACTKLTPSDVFTVPQHAVPGHLGYCDIHMSHTVKNVPGEHQVPAVVLAQSKHLDEEEEGGGGGGEGDDSGTFVVQPHAYPDSQGYCDIEIKQKPTPSHNTAATQPDSVASTIAVTGGEGGGGGGDDSGTFVVPPHAYPDSQGYCDVEIKQSPPSHSSTAATQPDSDASTAAAAAAANVGAGEIVTDAQGYCDIDILPPPTDDKPIIKDSEIVTDARGYCDIDILPPPTSESGVNSAPALAKDFDTKNGTDDMVMDAQGYCDIDIKTPSKSVSHEYEIVPESAKQNSAASKGGSKSVPSPAAKAPPVPSSRPTKPGSKSTQDKTQEESTKASGESSNSKGVPPKRPPPRRRAPPPPPLKSKTVDEPSEKPAQSSPLGNELVISTGLATLPRSPKRQPPRPPPPFASSNSPLLSRKMSPLVGKKLDLKPPLPSSSPLSSPVPPGSPKSLDSTNEQPQSSGLKKKFKGFFKQKQTASSVNGTAGDATNAASNSSSSGGLMRRPSWSRKKKGKATNDAPSSQDSGVAQLSPSTKARSLPGYALHHSQPQQGAGPPPPKLQLQCSYDADQEDEDEFGIYSTIQEDKLKPSSAEAETVAVAGAVAAAAVVPSPDDLKDDGVRHNFSVHIAAVP